jgi:hypothetical protein
MEGTFPTKCAEPVIVHQKGTRQPRSEMNDTIIHFVVESQRDNAEGDEVSVRFGNVRVQMIRKL